MMKSISAGLKHSAGWLGVRDRRGDCKETLRRQRLCITQSRVHEEEINEQDAPALAAPGEPEARLTREISECSSPGKGQAEQKDRGCDQERIDWYALAGMQEHTGEEGGSEEQQDQMA